MIISLLFSQFGGRPKVLGEVQELDGGLRAG
jgi:hypothetical protein